MEPVSPVHLALLVHHPVGLLTCDPAMEPQLGAVNHWTRRREEREQGEESKKQREDRDQDRDEKEERERVEERDC